MNDFRPIYKFLGVSLMLAVFGLAGAWADEKITIKTDSDGKVTIQHDAINDIFDDTYSTITVKKAPPEPRNEEEYIQARPDDKALWLPGYWRWDTATSDYEWISGVWRRPIPNQTWHDGKWISAGDSYVWQRGYWGPEDATKLVHVEKSPPAPREETKGTSPGPGYVWVAGVWTIENEEFVWRPGTWERPATEDMTWVPGAWLKTSTGYELVPGHWDYTVESRTYVVEGN